MSRRKPRVVWLPPTDRNSLSPEAPFTSGYGTFVLDLTATLAGQSVVGEAPLTIDSQDDPLDPNTSLSDLENSGYRLRRIVSKIWLTQDQISDAEDAGPARTIVTAGIIIRRSDPATGNSYASTVPGGEAADPSRIPNWGDPWIWRRSWMLGDNGTPATATLGPVPTSNMEYGSVADGPHIDQKTARLVGPEERTFLNVSVTSAAPGDGVVRSTIRCVWDIRLLASMRTSAGNRRNASR